LFGITALPYGVYSGFVSTAMPYLLRNAGIPVDRIAEIGSLALAPAVWYFLWSPIADVGLRRRTWLILSAASSAICLCAALRQRLPGGIHWFLVLVVAGSALNMLVGAANGGLMAATVPDSERGKAGGWYQAGNVGGGALGAGVLLWLSPHLTATALGNAAAAMVMLPSLAALFIAEPLLKREPFAALLAEMLCDLKTMFRSKTSLTGLAILLSPMGAAAAANLFSGIAVDFGAPQQMVVWITGLGGGLLTSVGALAGGVLCDRIPRRVAYALAALASAVSAGGMMLAPLTRTTFAIGVSLYLAAQGIAFAAFAALQLELVGAGGRSGATRYTLYGSAGNVPIMYMTWLDGQGYKHSGVRGLLGVDALSNILAAAICLLLLRRGARKTAGA
jgi:hypothetical protein